MIDRIRHRSAFDRLRREGCRVRIDPLWCSYVSDPRLQPPQVGYALGRAFGTAVRRNRMKRRLRAALSQSELRPGLYLIGAAPAAADLSAAELDTLVQTLRRRVDVL